MEVVSAPKYRAWNKEILSEQGQCEDAGQCKGSVCRSKRAQPLVPLPRREGTFKDKVGGAQAPLSTMKTED